MPKTPATLISAKVKLRLSTYLFAPEITRREHVLHLIGQKKFFELIRDGRSSLGNMDVSNDESELHGHKKWLRYLPRPVN